MFAKPETKAGQFNFFINVDYQLQYHKAFRTANNLPERYNLLHELNAGYGLEYAITKNLVVSNVLAFGRYLEIFNNTKSGEPARFAAYNRLLRLQLLYNIR